MSQKRVCINCDKLLVRNQMKFCSRKCRRAVYYQSSPSMKNHNKKWQKENPEKMLEYHNRYYLKNPEKKKAHRIRHSLEIPKGHLCEDCDERPAVHRHHEDYSKPSQVKLLCRRCHDKIHRKPYILNPKILSFLFIILILLLPFVIAQGQVVQVPQQQPAEKESTLGKYFGFLTSPIFWGAVVLGVGILGLCLLAFFVIKWILQFIKSQNDVFFLLIKERKKLAKVHRRYNSTHWLKASKNTPIRLVRKMEDGKVKVSQPIAYHHGDYVSHEGNIIISMYLKDNKKWFILPIVDLLIIPDRDKIKLEESSENGKIKKKEVKNIPRARDIVQFNDDEILLYAEGVSNSGQFYVPVLRDSKKDIIDLTMPIYQSLKEVVVGDYLYTQTSHFVDIARKSMDINPNIRAVNKVQDSSQSVEVPKSE